MTPWSRSMLHGHVAPLTSVSSYTTTSNPATSHPTISLHHQLDPAPSHLTLVLHHQPYSATLPPILSYAIRCTFPETFCRT
eukprot:2458106-Rhodomonas_salina.1